MTLFHLECGRLRAGLHRYLCGWKFLWGADWVLTPANLDRGVEAFPVGPGFSVLSNIRSFCLISEAQIPAHFCNHTCGGEFEDG